MQFSACLLLSWVLLQNLSARGSFFFSPPPKGLGPFFQRGFAPLFCRKGMLRVSGQKRGNQRKLICGNGGQKN
uniref:Hypothetical secreted protein n=1 Tax=Ornithodoros coriaceus TaxID=92741 RepID=B2D2E0_ORNCO|nr:hypothetical secreted protein precursor [Ornithodoros coriaceus]